MRRIDTSRLPMAHRILDFTLSRIWEDGKYHPPFGLFPETTGYQAELAGSLASAGKLLGREDAIKAAGRMFERLLSDETRIDGLWGLDWWGEFPKHMAMPDNWRASNQVVDVRYTAATLWSLALYHRASGDESVVEVAAEAMALMFERFAFSDPSFRAETIHLAAEFAAIAGLLWSHRLPQYLSIVQPIIDWVIETWVDHAAQDFPFFTAVRTMLLLGATGNTHLHSVVIPAFEAMLAEPHWRFDIDGRHFRHIPQTDADHVNIRGNLAVLITMRMIDVALEESHYTATEHYHFLADWADSMVADDGGYFEAWNWETDERFGQGSPACYIPCWWIHAGVVIEPC